MNPSGIEACLGRVRELATTLSERCAAPPAGGSGAPTEGAERWRRLRAVLVGYGPTAEEEFCAQGGRRPEEMPAQLQPGARVLGLRLPWVERLAELLQPVGEPGETEAEHPFAELLRPLLRRVESGLAQDLGEDWHWLSESAWAGLGEALLARWEREFAPAIYACFDVERSLLPPGADLGRGNLYRAFVQRLARSGLGEVAWRFPVAARVWAEHTVQWVEALTELTRHYLADRDELRRALQLRDVRVRRVVWPLSDFHDGGRAVARLEFTAGEIVYYKPGDRSLDLAFDRFFRSWLVRRQPSRAPALRGLVRGDRSWIEALPEGCPSNPATARELARDLGRLGWVGLFLGTTDLHPGNVVAGPGWASVCDAETVLHPERPEFPWRAPFLDPVWQDLDNPFRTFLASFAVAGRPEVHLRSCLGSWESEPGKVRQPVWRNLGGDRLSLQHEVGTWPNSFAGAFSAVRRQLGPRWAAALLTGASEARSRLQRAGPAARRAVERLARAPRRLLRRNTVAYAWMLAEARHPAFWQDGFERSLFFERLGELSGDGRILEPGERAALERGDVPRFETSELPASGLQRLFDPKRPLFDRVAVAKAGRALRRVLAPEADPALEAEGAPPGVA